MSHDRVSVFDLIEENRWNDVLEILTLGRRRLRPNGRGSLARPGGAYEDDEEELMDDVMAMAACESPNVGLPLHAALLNRAPAAVIEALVHAFPDGCAMEDAQFRFPLELACLSYFATATGQASAPNVFQHLLSFCPDQVASQPLSSAVDRMGGLALHYVTRLSANVVRGGNANEEAILGCARALLNAFPQAASAQDLAGKLPLHYARRHAVARLLLHIHPDGVRCLDVDGRLPLHYCCRGPAVPMAPSYPSHNDALICADHANRELSHASAKEDHDAEDDVQKLVQELLERYSEAASCKSALHGGRSLPLHDACSALGSSLPAIRTLLRIYPNAARVPTVRNAAYPLHLICARNTFPIVSFQIAELLISVFPEAVTKTTKRQGQLPLHMACFAIVPPLQLVRLLLEAYPDATKVRDANGLLPLMVINNSLTRYLHWYPSSQEIQDVTPPFAEPILEMFYMVLKAWPEAMYMYMPSVANRTRLIDSPPSFSSVPKLVEQAYGFHSKAREIETIQSLASVQNMALHTMIRHHAPFEAVQALLKLSPGASQKTDEDGCLPLQSLMKRIFQTTGATPSAVNPLSEACRMINDEAILQLLIEHFGGALSEPFPPPIGLLPFEYACLNSARAASTSGQNHNDSQRPSFSLNTLFLMLREAPHVLDNVTNW